MIILTAILQSAKSLGLMPWDPGYVAWNDTNLTLLLDIYVNLAVRVKLHFVPVGTISFIQMQHAFFF
jgi:hypothetical protein